MSVEEAEERIASWSGGSFLDLSGLGLTSVPDSIAQLTALTQLRLDDNQLTSVPDSIGQLSGRGARGHRSAVAIRAPNPYCRTLRATFRGAMDLELIGRSPCRAIKLPNDRSVERQVIEPADLHRLADTVGPRWRAIIYVGGVMGLRFGEGRVSIDVPKTTAGLRTLAIAGPDGTDLVTPTPGWYSGSTPTSAQRPIKLRPRPQRMRSGPIGIEVDDATSTDSARHREIVSRS